MQQEANSLSDLPRSVISWLTTAFSGMHVVERPWLKASLVENAHDVLFKKWNDSKLIFCVDKIRDIALVHTHPVGLTAMALSSC